MPGRSTFLQAVRCAFCGEVYPPGTPPSQHEALTAHIKVCPEHPMRQAETKIAELQGVVSALHPRILRLLAKGRQFLVVGEHEPYYMQVYGLIREQEMEQGTWTEEDRVAYAAAQLNAE